MAIDTAFSWSLAGICPSALHQKTHLARAEAPMSLACCQTTATGPPADEAPGKEPCD